MQDVLPVIVSGIVSGSAYALMGLGIVIIFRATDVANFAQGDLGTLGVFTALWALGLGVPLLGAVVIAVLVSGVAGVLTERLLIRPLGLGRTRLFAALVITLGLSMLIQAFVGAAWGYTPKPFPALIDGSVMVFGINVTFQKILSTVLALIALTAVAVFFRRSLLGVAMRASAQDQIAANLIGIDNAAVARISWFIGSCLSGLAAVFIAADSSLYTTMMTGPLFRSFAGGLFGGITSMVGAPFGGILIGMLDNLAGRYGSAGLRDTVVFAVIILVLFLRPEGIAGTEKRGRV